MPCSNIWIYFLVYPLWFVNANEQQQNVKHAMNTSINRDSKQIFLHDVLYIRDCSDTDIYIEKQVFKLTVPIHIILFGTSKLRPLACLYPALGSLFLPKIGGTFPCIDTRDGELILPRSHGWGTIPPTNTKYVVFFTPTDL